MKAGTAATLVTGFTWQVAVVLGLAIGLGALGGLVHRWTTGTGVPPLHKARGLWQQGACGGVAALAVVAIARPVDALAFVSGVLVAGYVGRGILALMEARW